ncbi:MAG: ABC transporter permease [Pseudomonadota bacterium]
MFQARRRQSMMARAFALLELIFISTVRQTKRGYRSGLLALVMNILQIVIFVAVFYVIFEYLGLRGSAIRGDFILYMMTGIFLFITNAKTIGAVLGAEGPASPMMHHAPMNTAVAIAAAALSALYIQALSLLVVLTTVHVALRPLVIYDPGGALMMFILSWFSGLSIGIVLLALKPWAPNLVKIIALVYTRANMIASGKMFVVNQMPPRIRDFFDWNPLFHIIDQARGYTFINYNPMHTGWEYPLLISVILLFIGLLIEFSTKRNASISWFAGR